MSCMVVCCSAALKLTGESAMHYLVLILLLAITALWALRQLRAEDCNTNCGNRCRVILDTFLFGRREFIEPTCNLKCEIAKKVACIIGRSIPDVPLSIKEGIEGTTRNLCGVGFYAFTETISAQCNGWDGRLEDQYQITLAKNLLIQRGYFAA